MKNRLLLFVLGTIVALSSCKKEDPVVSVQSVSLNQTTCTLIVGDKETLCATVAPADATNKKVIWNSSPAGIVTIAEGVVTAAKEGVATVTVTTEEGKKTAECKVTVTPVLIPVNGVSITPATLSLKVGETSKLIAAVIPDNASNKNVAWSSGAPTVASVNKTTGEVKAETAGSATIIVTTEDGKKTAECRVTVEESKLLLSSNIIIEEPSGVAALRIYVSGSGENATLQLTRKPANYGALFQFGGVIAWNYNTADNDKKAPGDAAFNPTILSPSAGAGLDNIGWGGKEDWKNIPMKDNYFTDSSISDVDRIANMKKGIGDPCRLVGYTVKWVREALAAGTLLDNGEWRLPTHTENASFAGGKNVTRLDWATPSSDAISGHYFPTVTSTTNFLPAAGHRSPRGIYTRQGKNGGYWSSSFSSDGDGYYLYFSDTAVGSLYYDLQAYGFSARCVPQ